MTLVFHSHFVECTTVSAQLEARGSIFHQGFLGELLFEFIIPGALIKKGLALLIIGFEKSRYCKMIFKILHKMSVIWHTYAIYEQFK